MKCAVGDLAIVIIDLDGHTGNQGLMVRIVRRLIDDPPYDWTCEALSDRFMCDEGWIPSSEFFVAFRDCELQPIRGQGKAAVITTTAPVGETVEA